MTSNLHCSFYISVQLSTIDIEAEYTALSCTDSGHASGALACFVGRVRGDEVLSMTLEHYPGMTENTLNTIVVAAAGRWQLEAVRVIHRIGRLLPGEEIVFVGVQSRHRDAAFSACAYIMDYLKTDAPFWKKEETAAGSRWVTARDKDNTARERWEEKNE